ncbi:MAG: hypothetical protein OXI73_14455 [Rhodospirillales bacterium]|nr:hypothetical protein [Rhodospirillales bacterium]
MTINEFLKKNLHWVIAAAVLHVIAAVVWWILPGGVDAWAVAVSYVIVVALGIVLGTRRDAVAGFTLDIALRISFVWLLMTATVDYLASQDAITTDTFVRIFIGHGIAFASGFLASRSLRKVSLPTVNVPPWLGRTIGILGSLAGVASLVLQLLNWS